MTIVDHIERAIKELDGLDLASAGGHESMHPNVAIAHGLVALAQLEVRRQRRDRRTAPLVNSPRSTALLKALEGWMEIITPLDAGGVENELYNAATAYFARYGHTT